MVCGFSPTIPRWRESRPISSLRYGSNRGRISILRTLGQARQMWSILRQAELALSDVIARFQPQAVVADFGLCARAGRPGRPAPGRSEQCRHGGARHGTFRRLAGRPAAAIPVRRNERLSASSDQAGPGHQPTARPARCDRDASPAPGRSDRSPRVPSHPHMVVRPPGWPSCSPDRCSAAR